jgi:hypothetical protein
MTQVVTPPPIPRSARAPEDDPAMRMLLPIGRSGWAIVAGYLGLLSVLLVPAPFALAVSIVAIRDIRKSRQDPRPRRGMGRAVFGLVMGVLGTIGLLAMIISAVAR